MTVLDQISQLVRDANPERNSSNLCRRSLKLVEEMGEVAEAFLGITSASNGKQKTWDDVREEVADCLIVALDIAWTRLHDESDIQPFRFVDTAFREPFDYRVAFKICYHLGLYVEGIDLYSRNSRHEIGLVVGLMSNLALSPMPDQVEMPAEELETALLSEVNRKLAKWATNRANMQVVTDDV